MRKLYVPSPVTREVTSTSYQVFALTDALCNGSLNPAQTEIVRALREVLGLLEDVKVLNST